MPVNIVVPELGESVVEATISAWRKKPGEAVAAGEAVVDLETEKVNLEVAAERAGVLARIDKPAGADVRVGEVIGVIDAPGAEPAAQPAGKPAAGTDGKASAPQAAPAQPAAKPEPAAKNEPATKAESAVKAESSANAEPAAKTESVAKVEPANKVEPASKTEPAAKTDVAAKAESSAKAEPAAKSEPAAPVVASNGDRATPVARRLAEEKGVDLAQVQATGAGGRVTRHDVEAFLQQPAAEPAGAAAAGSRTASGAAAPAETEGAAEATAPAASPVAADTPALVVAAQPPAASTKAPPAPENSRREERVRMSRRRRTIARRLVEAQQTAAMLTTFNEIDLGAVMDIRKRRKESFKAEHGVGLGFMSFFVKASIGALKAFPALNAEIQEDEIVYKHYYDIGMAIGSAEGLVVPVLRDADRMTFAQIEQAVDALVQKAQQSTLTLDDLRGGTFTLTNGGVFGSLMSTPILNPPQVGILGLHKIEDRPVARDGAVVIRPMMYVALSYDHRLVDGREAVQFLVRVKQLIEDPETLLLEG